MLVFAILGSCSPTSAEIADLDLTSSSNLANVTKSRSFDTLRPRFGAPGLSSGYALARSHIEIMTRADPCWMTTTTQILDAAFEGAYQKLATRYRRAGNVRLARKIEQADPGAGPDQWDPVLETVRAKWELRELAELLYPTDTARWLMTLDLTLMALSDIVEELHRWATASRNALAADVPAHQALMAILAIWIAPSTAVSLDWRGALDTLVADRSLSRAVRYLALRARSARSEAESK